MSNSTLTYNDKYQIFINKTPDEIKSHIDSGELDEQDIYGFFSHVCGNNLTNAQWLFLNYKDICEKVFTHKIARNLAVHNRKEALLWLKSLDSPLIKKEVEMFISNYILDKHVFDLLCESFPDIHNEIKSRITYVPANLSLKDMFANNININNSTKPTNDIFFNQICRIGNPEIIESFMQLNDIGKYTIGTGFDNGCMFNLDNAKWLYQNYKDACESYISSTCFFTRDLLNHNKIETLLWLKSLNIKSFFYQIDLLFILLINEKSTDCDIFKLLYEHFHDRFLCLKNESLKNDA